MELSSTSKKDRSAYDDFNKYLEENSRQTARYKNKTDALPLLRRMQNENNTDDDDTDYIIGMKLPKTAGRGQRTRDHKSIQALQAATPSAKDARKKIIASFVPDDIIYNVGDYSIREHEICLLFGDVSGFTDLSEKYNQPGRGGPSRLTQVLNIYIGSMVQEILSHGGDIFKFSGDAFLAFWKVRRSLPMQEAVHEGMDSALIIQKRYGQYPTDVGVTLRVKVAIAAGDVEMALIGTESDSHYVVVGQPVWDAKNAEKLSGAGEVICSPTAWQYVNPGEYVHALKSDNKHVKVLGFGPLWRAAAMQQSADVDEDETADHDPMNDPMLMNLSETTISLEADRFMIRPAVNAARRAKVKDQLRRFVLPPVMNAIDNDQPMDYLTEMRQVVIMFINIVPINKFPGSALIKLVDACYIVTCEIIREFEGGVVNKVSLFDKDLMIVVIFGLRGFKREFESQTALRVGAEIRRRVSKLQNQKSVSVAVTTGMTYCGVVGHTLRREYSVIGMVVNKAARLMCAYEDSVCCDKDTFIHSKMEARNFTLLKHKELKGLHAVGPVYAFNEIMSAEDTTRIELCKYPLLGCDYLMRHYFDVLLRYAEAHEQAAGNWDPDITAQNVLVYKGEARQGKTRLLDELLYLTPQKYNVTRINLFPQHQKVPYSAISLTISRVLEISLKDNVTQREAKLVEILKHLEVPQLLCSLNEVFNVQFELSKVFLSLPEEKQVEVRGTIFQQLINSVSMTLWVVIVDNLEYTDEESWLLLPYVIESNSVFYAATLGNRRKVSEMGLSVLNHPRVLTVMMPRIDNWYHAALACQMLEVFAIPLELEKIIQTRSEGNPGWIESFMLSLIQSGGLHIRTIRQKEVLTQGLVIPPPELMIRLSAEELLENIRIMNFGISRETYGWSMYDHTFHTADMEIDREASSSLAINFIAVAMLPPNFNPKDFEADITMDLMILMIFDSLNVFEQMVCKVSAVLGESFMRDMLKYVLGGEEERALAESIMKLFEIKVLACGSGDVTVRISSDYDKLVCYCDEVNYLFPEMPKYAFCERMMFKMPMFRETVYSLMTDRQRKDSHTRAFNYLERETRRCKSCGGGFFVRILGGRDDQRLHTKKMQGEKSYISYSQRLKETTKLALFVQQRLDAGKEGDDQEASEAFYRSYTNIRNDKLCGFCTPDRRILFGFCCPKLPRVIQPIESLTRTFSSHDFRDCECSLILMAMYSQIIDHCRGAEMFDIIMDAYVEYATVCISSGNLAQAIALLTKAKTELSKRISNADDEIVWRKNTMFGKINTLLGHSYLELGQMENAYLKLHEALHDFGYRIPFTDTGTRVVAHAKRWKLKLMMDYMQYLIGSLDGYAALFCEQVAECLCVMCTMFKQMDMWHLADLTSVWALTMSLESDKDFYITCTSYTNVLDVAYHYGRHGFSWWLEKCALVMVSNKQTDDLMNNDLSSVARLYFAIFLSRLLRCELISGITLGYKTLGIAETIQPYTLRLHVLPMLIGALISRIRVMDAVTLLKQLEYASNEDTDNSAACWYYSLCLDLALDTGYTLETYQQCEKFYHDECDTLICTRDPDSERAFYATMWLWCVRNSEWEAVSFWEHKVRHIFDVISHHTIQNTKGALRVLEGLINKMVLAMQSKDFVEVLRTNKIIEVLKKSLGKSIKQVKSQRASYHIMLAYLRKVEYNDNKALKMMQKCKQISIRDQNLSLVKSCEHQIQYWKGTLSPVLVDLWLKNCSFGQKLSWHEAQNNENRIICYTLHLPRDRM